MTLRIVSADERLAQLTKKDTVAIFGPVSSGKTSLLRTIDPATVLVIDMESGLRSVSDVPFDTAAVKSFMDFADLSVILGGPNPALRAQDLLSSAHYAAAIERQGKIDTSKYNLLFVDSLTELTRLAAQYVKTLPGSMVEKKNSGGQMIDDNFFVYRELAGGVLGCLRHLQHNAPMTVVMVGILEQRTDDFNRVTWQPQMAGAAIGRELPGLLDHVFILSQFNYENGSFTHAPGIGEHRCFVTQVPNSWGLPAKSRSQHLLDVVEKGDLGYILSKINGGKQA